MIKKLFGNIKLCFFCLLAIAIITTNFYIDARADEKNNEVVIIIDESFEEGLGDWNVGHSPDFAYGNPQISDEMAWDGDYSVEIQDPSGSAGDMGAEAGLWSYNISLNGRHHFVLEFAYYLDTWIGDQDIHREGYYVSVQAYDSEDVGQWVLIYPIAYDDSDEPYSDTFAPFTRFGWDYYGSQFPDYKVIYLGIYDNGRVLPTYFQEWVVVERNINDDISGKFDFQNVDYIVIEFGVSGRDGRLVDTRYYVDSIKLLSDETPPYTNIFVNYYYKNIEPKIGPTKVFLESYDDGFGVSHIMYRYKDTNGWSDWYISPNPANLKFGIDVSEIEYYAVDNLGNAEEIQHEYLTPLPP